ncbi:MAG: TonB-dependent receptor plug domain-containing protein, partial [Candidatus Latescibacterota bacterium]
MNRTSIAEAVAGMHLPAVLGMSLFFGAVPGQAKELPRVDAVVVESPAGGRFLDAAGMETRVITAEEIGRMQAATIPELLNSISSISLTERGAPGSQADISIRGSSTEGVLLLVNGIRVQDPQTGHFLLDIPLDLGSVERVEILSGGGSTLYGSSASGGIVNIVTREGGRGGNGTLTIGSFGNVRAGGSVSGKAGDAFSLSANARWERSDGHTTGTDLEYTGIDGSGAWNTEGWNIRWNAGVLQKRFGAQGFYAAYPSFEEVMTVQAGMHALHPLNERSLLRVRVGSRGHRDAFTLIRDRPDFYRNTHYNRSYTVGGEYVRTLASAGSFTFGTEAEREGIASGSLGSHSGGNAALYGEFSGNLRKSPYSFSLRYDRGRRNKGAFSPGFGIVLPLSGVYKLRVRLERSFRAPNYTELYYADPANRGNPGLGSERSSSAEAGLNRITDRSEAGATLFVVRTARVIDWVRNPGETVWSAVNHGRLLTAGAEMSYAARFYRDWRFRGNATIMRQWVRGRQGRESKYILNPAEGTVTAALYGPLAANLDG